MKKIISEISQEERNRILEMHKKVTTNQYLVNEQMESEGFKLVPGLIGVVTVGTYEGRTYDVKKVTPLNCGMVEVEFGPNKYGYYNPEDVYEERRAILFKRFGEGVKANNPCEQSEEFDSLGEIQFGTKPGEKPNIYQ
jgi:hypothetical protein